MSSVPTKAEWGLKRTCAGCGAKFYDMRREPVTCPRCGALYAPQATVKTRTKRAAPAEEERRRPVVAPVPKKEEPAVEPKAETEETESEEEVIEDTSELGEDEDDVAEVIEGIDEDEPS